MESAPNLSRSFKPKLNRVRTGFVGICKCDPITNKQKSHNKKKDNEKTKTQPKRLSSDAAKAMCTLEKRGDLFFLTLTGDDDHRLGLPIIDSLLSAIAEAKSQATRGSVLITTAQGKFFSNGFDLGWAQSAGSATAARARLNQMVLAFKPVVVALLSLPMPTIAAVQGHAAAAGFLFALSHDYFLMRRDRGVLYMSEVDLGLPFPDYFTAAFRSKIGSVSGRRDVMLRGMKVKGEEAVKMGIVESAHDSAESTVEAAVRLGEQLGKRKWNGDVYAEIRKSLYPELCGVLGVAIATPKAKL